MRAGMCILMVMLRRRAPQEPAKALCCPCVHFLRPVSFLPQPSDACWLHLIGLAQPASFPSCLCAAGNEPYELWEGVKRGTPEYAALKVGGRAGADGWCRLSVHWRVRSRQGQTLAHNYATKLQERL